jgi:FMN phosphatase YigB (HAD superfamily)
MVGDSFEADILGARAIGLRAIWITRRVPAAAQAVTDPVERVLTLKELPPLLLASMSAASQVVREDNSL